MNILKYRKLRTEEARREMFPKLWHLIKGKTMTPLGLFDYSKWIGVFWILVAWFLYYVEAVA